LLALLQVADALRVQHHGDVITYSRKVFLPLTNLCRDYCGYCTFRKDPGDPGAKTMTPDEVLEVASTGARLGCKEAVFSLGDKPEALFAAMRQELQRYGQPRTLDYLVQMCQLVLDHTRCYPIANPGSWDRRIGTLARGEPEHGLCSDRQSPSAWHRHGA
jgi:FO synthase